MTPAAELTFEPMVQEFEAFKAREFAPGTRVFYDGPMDPLQRWSAQESRRLDAEIEAAGGLEAWRALPDKAPQAA